MYLTTTVERPAIFEFVFPPTIGMARARFLPMTG
jgi:hypothetical protein